MSTNLVISQTICGPFATDFGPRSIMRPGKLCVNLSKKCFKWCVYQNVRYQTLLSKRRVSRFIFFLNSIKLKRIVFKKSIHLPGNRCLLARMNLFVQFGLLFQRRSGKFNSGLCANHSHWLHCRRICILSKRGYNGAYRQLQTATGSFDKTNFNSK